MVETLLIGVTAHVCALVSNWWMRGSVSRLRELYPFRSPGVETESPFVVAGGELNGENNFS